MKIKNITALFDEPGPQLTLKEHGPEPSLRQIVMMYYQQIGGVPVHRAKVLTEK